MTLLVALDFAAVFVFALTGALTASRAQLDPVGFAFLAALTAVGGGTVRDLLLDRNPVFWIAEPAYVLTALAAAAIVFFTAHRLESRLRVLLWLDAVALSVAAAAGMGVALSLGQTPVVAALMGIVTGCMGGLMRDVVANDVPVVLRQGELYVSAALAGSLVGIGVAQVSDTALLPLATCAGVTLVLRGGALAFGWRLPTYRSRPPR